MPNLHRNTIFYQVVLLLTVLGIGIFIFQTTQANLQRLGVDSGFAFLFKRAGFEIGQSLIAYDADSTIARAFLVALLNTLVLAAAGIAGASILGLVIGVCRLSSNFLLSRMAMAYVELFRNIPSLLQIFFWYFFVLRILPSFHDSMHLPLGGILNNRGLFLPGPELTGHGMLICLALVAATVCCIILLRWHRRRLYREGRDFPLLPVCVFFLAALPLAAMYLAGVVWEIPRPGRFGYEGGVVLLPEFLALVCGLSMYNATYISEVVRSGFASVPRGQMEAAESLGLSRGLALQLVIFPQALRVMLPPLTTIYLNLFKSTSLAAAVAYPEVVSVLVGTVNNLVGQPVSIMAITMVVYATISLCAAALLNWYGRRLALRNV